MSIENSISQIQAQPKTWISLEDIHKSKSQIEHSQKLIQVNNVLKILDFPDNQEETYRKILEKQDSKTLKNLSLKSKDEILIFLINTNKILTKTETKKIWIENKRIATKISKIKSVFPRNILDKHPNITNKLDSLDKIDNPIQKNEILEDIIAILKNPWTLESITKDLGWVDTPEYKEFRNTLISIDPTLRETFDRVELNQIWNLAKIKLWTDDLSGVDLDSDTLSKTEDWITTSYSNENGRNLSTTWSNYKIPSEINPKYEKDITELNTKTNEELKPLNDNLNLVSQVLKYLKNAQKSWIDFSKVKNTIKIQNPNFYTNKWLDNITSFDEMIIILNAKKFELEEEKEEAIETAREKIDELLKQNTLEAKKQDKKKKKVLEFIHSIWFDRISQSKTNLLLDYININLWKFALQEKIDLQNASLGFDKDFWNDDINPLEKRSFINLFNKMLGENLINENIANGTTSLSLETISKLQKLSNRTTWFFISNLEKKMK